MGCTKNGLLFCRFHSIIVSSDFQAFIDKYEQIVAGHQQYIGAFKDAQTRLDTIKNAISVCSELNADRITLQGSLERLKVMIGEEIERLI